MHKVILVSVGTNIVASAVLITAAFSFGIFPSGGKGTGTPAVMLPAPSQSAAVPSPSAPQSAVSESGIHLYLDKGIGSLGNCLLRDIPISGWADLPDGYVLEDSYPSFSTQGGEFNGQWIFRSHPQTSNFPNWVLCLDVPPYSPERWIVKP
jgi:hypothetical protein